jgi:hypothetical protein
LQRSESVQAPFRPGMQLLSHDSDIEMGRRCCGRDRDGGDPSQRRRAARDGLSSCAAGCRGTSGSSTAAQRCARRYRGQFPRHHAARGRGGADRLVCNPRRSPAVCQIAGCPAAAVDSRPSSSLRTGASAPALLSRLQRARCTLLSAWSIPDLEWMPGRLDRAGRTLQALPRLLGRVLINRPAMSAFGQTGHWTDVTD